MGPGGPGGPPGWGPPGPPGPGWGPPGPPGPLGPGWGPPGPPGPLGFFGGFCDIIGSWYYNLFFFFFFRILIFNLDNTSLIFRVNLNLNIHLWVMNNEKIQIVTLANPFFCFLGSLSFLCCCWLLQDCFGGPFGPPGPPGPPGPFGPPPP